MSDGAPASGHSRLDFLRGLRERLREPRHYAWPQYLTEGFGVDSQPATVECVCGEINARNCPVHGGDPECEHPECSEPFWEDGEDIDLNFCGPYGGSHQPSRPNAFCTCARHDNHESARDWARSRHPANGRDLDEHGGLGLHSRQGIGRQLPDRGDGTLRRGLPSISGNVAGPGLQWGAERSFADSPGRLRLEALLLGSEVHGQSVERMGDGPGLRIVKP